MSPRIFESVFGDSTGCPEGSLREARQVEQNAITELEIQRVQAQIAGNGDLLADIETQIAQHQAQLEAWAHCTEDSLDRARGSHFKKKARGSHFN